MADSSATSSDLYGDADPLRRFFAQQGAGAGAAAPDSQDGKLQQLIKGTSYLGKPVSVDLPGMVSTPAAGGPPSLPTVPGMGGVAGTATPSGGPAGATPGAGGGKSDGGSNLLAQIAQALGLGEKAAELLSKLVPSDLGTRGDVGGPGTPQTSDRSLSDQVRSALGGLTKFQIPGDVLSGASGGSAGAFDLAGAKPFTVTPDMLASDTSLPSGGFGTHPTTGVATPGGFTADPSAPFNPAQMADPAASIASAGGPDGFASLASLGPGVLSAIAGMIGDPGFSKFSKAIGDVTQLAALPGTIGGAIAGETVGSVLAATSPTLAGALPTAIASLSSAALPAVGAAIAMLTQLGMGIAAGNPPEQITLDTLAAPDIIVSNIMSNVIDPMFHPSVAYQTFPQRVGETAGLAGLSLQALMQGLPYVQSKEELGNLMNEFKRVIGTRVGGYGAGAGPYDLPGLPEVGPRTHGVKTTPTDFASITPEVQQAIQALLPGLPDTYTGTDTSDPMMRNFYQFMPRRAFAPHEAPGEPVLDPSGVNLAQGLYGDPGYNYAASGFPEPGQNLGAVSPYWQGLLNPQAAPQATQAAPAPDPLAAALLAQQAAPARVAPKQAGPGTLAMSLDEQLRRALLAQAA